MQPSRETILTLMDVENLVRSYEEKYDLTTAEFLRNDEARARIPEDDVFKWEAYIDHRRALRERHDSLHRLYLANLVQDPEKASETLTPERQVLLAA